MAPEKCVLSDAVRYAVFRSLGLDQKIPATIDLRIKTKPGPSVPIVPEGDLPEGTVSEILQYTVKVNGWRLVKAHQYRLPDGTIRGGPDPLYIRLDDVVICRAKDRTT